MSLGTNPSKERINDLVNRCRVTAKLARRTARVLAESSSNQKFVQHLIRAINFLIGAVVAGYSLVSLDNSNQQPGQQPSHTGTIIATLVAAAALLIDAALPTIMPEPNPDRFKDYAYYIDEFARELLRLADKPEETALWEANAEIHINLTRLNLDDVFRNFTQIRKKLESKNQYFDYWDNQAALKELEN